MIIARLYIHTYGHAAERRRWRCRADIAYMGTYLWWKVKRKHTGEERFRRDSLRSGRGDPWKVRAFVRNCTYMSSCRICKSRSLSFSLGEIVYARTHVLMHSCHFTHGHIASIRSRIRLNDVNQCVFAYIYRTRSVHHLGRRISGRTDDWASRPDVRIQRAVGALECNRLLNRARS